MRIVKNITDYGLNEAEQAFAEYVEDRTYNSGCADKILNPQFISEYIRPKNDFFIFQIAHFAKHYTTSGMGIRPIIDIWILLREWQNDLNWSYINTQLDILNFRKFAENIFKLIKQKRENVKNAKVIIINSASECEL